MMRGTFYKLVSWDIFLFKCILFSCSYLWSKCHFVLIDLNGNFLLKLIIGRHCYWISNWTTQSQCLFFVFMFWMTSFFFPNTHKMLGVVLSFVLINEILTRRAKVKKKKKEEERFRHITWVLPKVEQVLGLKFVLSNWGFNVEFHGRLLICVELTYLFGLS